MSSFDPTSHEFHHRPYRKLTWMALCGAVLVGGVCAQLPAHAGDNSATVRVAVAELTTPEGLLAARNRLHEKARQLCGRVVDPWALSHHWDYVRCVDESTAAAVRQLDVSVRVANARWDTDRSSNR